MKNNYKILDICDFKKGKPLSSQNVIPGKYGVVAGGTKINYYHKEYNDENCITISASGTAGHIMYHKNKKVFLSDCFSIKPKDKDILDKNYLYYFLVKNQTKMYKLASGSGIPHFYPKDFESFEIDIKLLAEQKRIAKILTCVDNNIDITEQEIKKLEQIQIGAMNKYFNLENNWDVKHIKDIASIKGGFAFASKDFVEKKGIQIIKMANLYQNIFNKNRSPTFVPKDFLELFKEYIIKQGDMIISLTGTLGKRDYGYTVKIRNTQEQFLLNQRVAKITPKEINPDFLYHLFLSEYFLNMLFNLGGGTKLTNLSTKEIESIAVKIPSDEVEQKRISDILNSILYKIDNLKQKKQKLEQLKKGLLNDLL
jgi:type I restriction enzyme S subunit